MQWPSIFASIGTLAQSIPGFRRVGLKRWGTAIAPHSGPVN